MRDSVVIIEKNDGIVQAYKRNLKPGMMALYITKSAEKGLEYLRTHCPKVLILDIQIPGPNGVELLRRIRANHPSLAIVATTAYSTSFTEADAAKEGVAAYFVKPFDVKQFFIRLNGLLALMERRLTEPTAELRNKQGLS